MSVTILEALQGANHNLDNIMAIGIEILPLIKDQLNNAVTLLEKDYSLYDEIEPLLEEYGNVESVPDKVD